MRVAINAQLIPGGSAGGTESVLIGLVKALGELEGPEEYLLVGPWQDADWLRTFAGPNQEIVRGPKATFVKRSLAGRGAFLAAARRKAVWLAGKAGIWPRIGRSTGFYEGLGCEVIHFPYQHFVSSRVPSVFNPHDLQHLHYPEFFSAVDIQWRESSYRVACREADTVVVHSDYVRRDLIRHYRVEVRRIQVILSPPAIGVYAKPTQADVSEVRRVYELKDRFMLYPAITWRHKNHLRLLEALALLRERDGLCLRLVCTGHQTEFFRQIRKRVLELGLAEQVRFLGVVPARHLRVLYGLADFTIFPTLFEGAGLPLVEAWAEGSPVACSGVTSLLELAGQAALLFDPENIEKMAEAIARIHRDEDLRRTLRLRGTDRLSQFSWDRAARGYRAIYRRAAGRELCDEDIWLLQEGQQ